MKNLTALFFMTVMGVKAQPPSTIKTGYAFSPQGYPNFPAFVANIPAFYSDVANTTSCNGGIVFGNTRWYDTYANAGQVPGLSQNIAASQPSPYGFSDMHTFVVSDMDSVYMRLPGQWMPNNFTNSPSRDSILVMLRSFAINFQPDYIFLGNEMNFYITKDSADYINFATLLAQAYDTVKLYSPATQFGTVFNFEHLSGSGNLIGWNTPHWNALTDIDTSKLDVIGITTYPFFKHPYASQVPASYLSTLSQKTGNKKIIITETGWPADSTQAGAPWACSSAQQVDFVNVLFDSILPNNNVGSVNWLFLNYLMSSSPGVNFFKSVAMRDSLGNDRPALQTLLSKCTTTFIKHETPGIERIHVFPNPASEILCVNNNFVCAGKEFCVYDLQGKKIFSKTLVSAEVNSVSISSLEQGVYMYKIIDAENTFSQGKFIKL